MAADAGFDVGAWHEHNAWYASSRVPAARSDSTNAPCPREEGCASDDGGATDAWLHQRLGSDVGFDHRVVRHLASGGMAHVFLAEHQKDGAYAAVKFSDPTCHVARALLRHEATILTRVQHAHIVKLLEAGRSRDGSEYLLLEYLHGLDLEEWLRRTSSPMTPERLLHVLAQLGSAIDHLHARNIVHGDIKPANVMFNANGGDRITLVDFGLAFDRCCTQLNLGSTGTPGYMSPEQLRGEYCGPAVDRFAFAAVAYELFTGQPLRPGPADESGPKRAAQALPFTLNRGAGDALTEVFLRGLNEQPEARFNTAAEFVTALAGAIGSTN